MTGASIDPATALEVLEQLDTQLGAIDGDARAVVALRVAEVGTVALTDVTLRDNGVLVPPDDAAGLVVVTGEDVAAGDEVVTIRQLVCVLPDGHEVGLYRAGAEGAARTWRTDADADDEAAALRPRDLASNTARRAFGLPSLVQVPPIADLLARAWLLTVAGEAIERFDAAEGTHEVSVDELLEVAAEPALARLGHGEPTWTDVHRAAVDGTLELGPFTVDPDHATWLDPDGLAQVLDRTVPPTEELLGSLEVMGDDRLLAWVIDWLTARGWYRPS